MHAWLVVSPSLRRQPTTKRRPSSDRPCEGMDQVLGDVLQELSAQAWHTAQLGQRLGLDLANALAADAQLLADLAQRSLVATIQTEPQPQDLSFAGVQLVER